MSRVPNERALAVVTRLMTVWATTTFAFLIACGSEPKKDPATGTAGTATTAPESPEVKASATSSADVAPTSADAGKPDKRAECDALVDDANQALDAERIAVDKACKKDADCMPIKGRACAFDCSTGAIPKAEEKDWTETLTKVKGEQCKKWGEGGCASLRAKPMPTCGDRNVWCDKGHCALKDK